MRLVVQHRRYVAAHLAKRIFLHYGESDSCRAYILLCASVYQGVFAHVTRTAHDVGRHVRYKRYRAVYVFLDLRTVDGIVRGDMEIVQIGWDFVSFRNIIECSICR